MKLLLKQFVVLIASLFAMLLCHAQSTERQYLSGTGNDHAVNWDFFCTAGMNANKWTTIPVPSCWELKGFGKYDYGFAKDSIRGKEKGLYKYQFRVPAQWKNKQVDIVFEGSMTDTEVKINGQLAGAVHQGAFYSFRYDISMLLKAGEENLLEVTVAKHSANASVNEAERKADFWIFGGIFRPVYLEALPLQHIDEYIIDAKANGTITADVMIIGKADRLVMNVYKPDGTLLSKPVSTSVGDNNHVVLEAAYPSPQLWSPESPALYKAVIGLYSGSKLVHTITQRVGFRTVQVKQTDGIYVNGVKVKMKGVNRHSFWPTSGRTTSRQLSIEDVLLMKDLNMNAVRMSHYPPDDHFLDVCDSLGLFVMDELAGWHGQYEDTIGRKLVREMMLHDRNHPSIIFWANGNEGGHNTSLDNIFSEYELSPRPVVHPWQLFRGIETQHYREYDYGIGNYAHGRDIVMPTEFLHGLYDGGHGAGLEDYWEAMWRNPLSAGGFLWDFADEGVVRKDRHDSIDTDGNRGADGIVGPFHQKEGSYYTIKEVWSPVYIEPKQITDGFDGTLNIENRFFYTNINQCGFTFYFAKPGNAAAAGARGTIAAPFILPSQKGQLKIKLPAHWFQYDVLYITANGPDKKEIFTWSFPIRKPASIRADWLVKNNLPAPGLTQTDSSFIVSANGVRIELHRQSGLLLQVSNKNGIIPFSKGPVLQEGVNNFGGFTYVVKDRELIISSVFDRKNGYNTMQWTIYPAGIVKMEVRYFPSAYFTEMVGVNFSYPEQNIQSVEYMGDGPYRVWKNRMKGNRFGVWKKEYNATETGEAPWIYPEFKGYHSNLYWCKFNEKNGRSFSIGTSTENVFLRLFTPAFKTDQWKNYEPIFPKVDISFMQGITSIGTKTQRNETTGPMGMKNIFYDYEKIRQERWSWNCFLIFDEEKWERDRRQESGVGGRESGILIV